MKKIMVFDVPAESGGALSVLNDFYNEYKADVNNEYIFIISKPVLQETKNIRLLRFPWIKKSWFHRLFFDYYIAPKLIKNIKADEVLSLQNIIIPVTKVPQRVLVHNALPFADYRFSINEDKLLWIYQNIISRKIYKSIRKANGVIVQTEWMKKKCINTLKVDEKKIEVLPPNVDLKVKNYYCETKESLSTFFYPASGVIFKNHKIIIDACSKLKEQGINEYKVICTLNSKENKYTSEMYERIKKYELPIEFIGGLSREEVFEYYTKSILIFPSLIETVGLPLIEAKMHNTPIIVSDLYFSREAIGDYGKADFITKLSSDELSEFMKKYIYMGRNI